MMSFGQGVDLTVVRKDGVATRMNSFRRRDFNITSVVGVPEPRMVMVPSTPALCGFSGNFNVACVKRDGTLRWRKRIKNGIVNQGLNKLLNIMFQSATQITTWYLDLIATGATLAAADTYVALGSWSYSSAYSNATRPAWAPAASTAQSSTNTSTVDFNINGTATIYGIAVVSGSSVKGNTASGTGVLWATGAFPGGEQSVVNGDTLKVTYTVNAAAA